MKKQNEIYLNARILTGTSLTADKIYANIIKVNAWK